MYKTGSSTGNPDLSWSSRDLSLGLETSRDWILKVLVLILVSVLMPRVSVLVLKVHGLGHRLETSFWLLNKRKVLHFIFLIRGKIITKSYGKHHDSVVWAYQTMHPLFEKTFSPLPLQLQRSKSLITLGQLGCSWGQTGHEWAIGCWRSWCFCACNNAVDVLHWWWLYCHKSVVNLCRQHVYVLCLLTVTMCEDYGCLVIC